MKYLTLLYIFALHTVVAQKHDYIWHFTNALLPSTPQTKIAYTLDFKSDSIFFDSIQTQVYLNSSAAFYSDSAGNLLFQTGGCFIADANGDTLPNGSEIGVNSTQYTNFCSLLGSYGVWAFGFFLPAPGHADEYYFFHPAGDNYITKIQYATIHKNPDGFYAVDKKNQVFIQDSIALGGIAATKHANGRDWWLLFIRERSNKLYKFLLEPKGLTDYGTQQIGVPLGRGRHSRLLFTPDGSLLAHADPQNDLRLWDFDRCTGTVSNPQYFPHQDTADFDTGIISGGMAISQDGRYLYRGNNFYAYQYDLEATDIGSTLTVVGQNDPASTMLLGGIMELGPDGRIYIKPANGTARTMHVISHPERPTSQCGFNVNHYYFRLGYAAMPMFPNYRLGPIDGSSCDTLGMNNYPLAGFRYDRLAGLLVNFTSVSWYEPDTWHWDFGDPVSGSANTSSDMHPDHVYSAPGLYTVCLTVSNQYGADTICKQVYIDESVDVYEPQLTETEQGVLVYPNPASSLVEWVFPVEVRGVLKLWNVATALATNSKWSVEAEATGSRLRIDMSDLPTGVYVWALHEPDGQVWSGKVVVVR